MSDVVPTQLIMADKKNSEIKRTFSLSNFKFIFRVNNKTTEGGALLLKLPQCYSILLLSTEQFA